MTQTILVGVGSNDADRIEQLTEQITTIADEATTKVILLHVFTDTNGTNTYKKTLDQLGYNRPDGDPTPTDIAKRQTTVRTLKEELVANNLDVTIQGRLGDPAPEIIDVAEDVEPDTIVVAGRKRSPAGKAMFGSVAQKVMMDAPCPVTFVRDSGDLKKTLKNAL